MKSFKIPLLAGLVMWLAAWTAGAQELSPPGFPDFRGTRPAQELVADYLVIPTLAPGQQAPGSAVVVEVKFICPPNWFIYHDKIRVALAEEDGRVLPVRAGEFTLPAPRTRYDQFLAKEVRYHDGKFSAWLVLDVKDDAPAGERVLPLEITYQGCSDMVCFAPVVKNVGLRLTVLPAGSNALPVALPPKPTPAATLDGSPPADVPAAGAAQAIARRLGEHGLLMALIVAYVLGWGLVLTPCVYPLIPVTLSVIGATATGSRMSGLGRSLVYVLGISVTYGAAGVIAGRAGETFGTRFQHPAFYVVMAVLFFVLAAAMFGVISIQLQSSWTARLQAGLRGRAGLIGIFLIGVLSAVAATACIAPVLVGAALYVTTTGDQFGGFLIFIAIAWGMGTPLVVLGTFSGLLKSLPKSGGWMLAVKYLFGFGLVGAGVYFIGQSGVLGAFWYPIFVGSVLLVASVFVGAFDQVPSAADRVLRGRKALGLLLVAGAVVALAQPLLQRLPAGAAEPREGIIWATSLEDARAEAREAGRPAMVYFWAERCSACVKLKKRTFPDPAVVEESKRFVCVMVDGTDWPRDQQVQMRKEYGVFGFPTITLVTSKGEVLSDGVLAGYVSPEKLLNAMRAVR